MKYYSFIAAMTLLSATSNAQIEHYNPLIAASDSNTAAVRFERNVNTYLWNANAFYLYDDDDFYLRVSDLFTSSFIRSQFSSYRDEQNLSLSMSQHVDGPYAATIEAQSFVLSDNQSFGTSTAGIHSGAIGVTYVPNDLFFITPMLGFRYDKQQNYLDQGLNYRVYSKGDSLELGDYQADFSGQLNQSNLKNRNFKNDYATVHLTTDFSPGSTDSIRVRWSQNRNDFYVPADSSILQAFGTSSNIRSRTDQIWGVQNTLVYSIGSVLLSQFSVNVESRSVRNAFAYQALNNLSSIPFNTKVQEFHIDGELKLDYRVSSLFASIAFQMSERNENHVLERINGIDDLYQDARAKQESRLDNVAFRNTLRSSVVSYLSKRDELYFSGSISLLQYDTPDSINTDDRDESLINITMKETHSFSSVFSASLLGEITLAHLVYLSREKSANNNWNRIFRIQPELKYHPSDDFHMFNSFEVSANYTVFDFESIVPSVKSYSYRQVAFLDSTSYDMTNAVGLDMFAYVRVYERGELHWQEFSERPLQRIEEVTFSPQLRYSFKGKWYFAIGFRSFAQKKFKYSNNVRQFESTFLSAGPTTSIVIQISPLSFVEIKGWKEFQQKSGGTIQEFSNMMMNVRYYF